MFVLVPLTIPFLIAYVAIKNWRVALPLTALFVLNFVIQVAPVVGIPILTAAALVTLWILRTRLADNQGRHAWVDADQ